MAKQFEYCPFKPLDEVELWPEGPRVQVLSIEPERGSLRVRFQEPGSSHVSSLLYPDSPFSRGLKVAKPDPAKTDDIEAAGWRHSGTLPPCDSDTRVSVWFMKGEAGIWAKNDRKSLAECLNAIREAIGLPVR